MRYILLFIGMTFFIIGFAQTKNARLNDILTHSDISWKKSSSAHFVFFVEVNQFADQHIDLIKDDFEATRKRIIGFLGDSSFIDTTAIIIVDTKEKIKNILGFEAQGFAIPENDIAVFLGSTEYTIAAKHELTHYYAFKIWGKPADNWFSEGLAVYYDNKWSGYQIDSLTRHLKDNHRLFKMSSLLKNFYALSPMIAYPQIGSFTGFLLSRYGYSRLKEFWKRGFRETRSVYGKSLKGLEEEWLGYVDGFNGISIDYSRHIK